MHTLVTRKPRTPEKSRVRGSSVFIVPYTKVVGNPARAIQKRFDDELIELLLRFKWWDRSIDEINRLIPILTCSDLDKVKTEIKKQLG